MALTGDPDGPPLFPASEVASVVDDALAPFGLDAAVLAERAASGGLVRRGRTSCGGASRLLPSSDGWVALTLSRPEDVDALPAVFEADVPVSTSDGPPWASVATLVAARPAAEVVERAVLLGLPVAAVGEDVAPFAADGTARIPGGREEPRPFVVDLSALWAGPLAAACLAATGADVVKVEDVHRPDGARRGDPDFFDLLNGAKRSVALDLRDAAGRRQLGDLVARADVVVTSGRARAIAGLGLDPDAFLAGASDRVWVAITGHGWSSDRVGFGDDAAVAGGLVAWHPEDGEPRFAADAVADPLCGALAARAALDAWSVGGRWFVDASLAGAAASVAASGPAEAARGGERGWTFDGAEVRTPVARRATGPGPALGAHTEAVLTEPAA